MSVPDEGYSNNALSALIQYPVFFITNYKGFRNKELDELNKSRKFANPIKHTHDQSRPYDSEVCHVYPILPISLNCPFLIAPSISLTAIYKRLTVSYEKIRLIRSLKKFIFRYQDLVEIYSVSAEKIINNGFSYSGNV